MANSCCTRKPCCRCHFDVRSVLLVSQMLVMAQALNHGAGRSTAGATSQLFYNRHWGPLRGRSGVMLKAGFNAWADIVEVPMRYVCSHCSALCHKRRSSSTLSPCT